MPEFPNPLAIALGGGKIAISIFHDRNGVHGLVFRDTGIAHGVGEQINDSDDPHHTPTEGEVYIGCANRESAMVLQDMANRVVDSFARPPESIVDLPLSPG